MLVSLGPCDPSQSLPLHRLRIRTALAVGPLRAANPYDRKLLAAFIPGPEGSTVRTSPLSNSQRHFFLHRLASRTGLAGRKPEVSHHHKPPLHFALYSSCRRKSKKPMSDREQTRLQVLHHAAHVQLFDDDGVKSSPELCRKLVQALLPDISNPGMQPCKPKP
jgi:hypothetical protein